MFTRSRTKLVALMALVAIVFAALLPASSAFARAFTNTDVVAMGGICATTDGVADPAVPVGHAIQHGHCAFCTFGAPLVSVPHVAALLAKLDAPASERYVHRNDALPRDRVAVHPLSPRAPPRAN